MRLVPALLLLAAAPALAQQGPVDPELVGTWTLDRIEAGAIADEVAIEGMTMTFTADGRVTASGTMVLGGERRTETMEGTFYTEGGRIVASEGSPADYALLGPDHLRISDGSGMAIHFRRLSR